MSMGPKNLQLTAISGGGRRREVAGEVEDEYEDVRLLEEYDEEQGVSEGERRRIRVSVTGMTCSACSTSVESALFCVPGVFSASVALLQNTADVIFDPNLIQEEGIKKAIEDAGFEAELINEQIPLTEKDVGRTLVSQFTIGGMTCSACVNSVEVVVGKLNGVKRAVVALATCMGEVEYDPSVITKDDIANAIEDAGFDATFLQSSGQDTAHLIVSGVLDSVDAQFLEGIVNDVKGVRQCGFDRASRELEVIFDPEAVNSRFLVDTIVEGGKGKFRVHVKNPYERMTLNNSKESALLLQLFISSSLLSIVMFLIRVVCPHIPLMDVLLLWRCGPFVMGDWLKWLVASLVQFGVGMRFYVAGWKALKNGSTNMDVLIALGTSASYSYSVYALLYGAITGFWSTTYFETSAMLITFVLLGKYLESVAKGKTSEAIKKLVELTPATAFLLVHTKGGKCTGEREIDALLIQPGDILKVIPGSKIPSDGIVVWGSSYVNESMVTGESDPSLKNVNSPVIGGTINLHGYLHVKATKVGSSTVLSQIIFLVQTAQMSKAPIQKFADVVAGIFVPTVVVMALLTFMGWYVLGALGMYPETWLPDHGNHFVFSLMFSIAVVVIACPCALGLATPTAVMVATGVGAANGVLIKGGDALERAQKVKYVVFDKTGTLTQGKPTVTTVQVFIEMGRGEFLKLVASAEANSEHPLARAIVDHTRHFHIPNNLSPAEDTTPPHCQMAVSDWLLEISDFSVLPGRGVQCTVDRKELLVGNRNLMTERGVEIPPGAEDILNQLEESANTGVLVAREGTLIGVLGVADPLKREASLVIEGLQKMGVIPVMVTGDNQRTAMAVAKEVGIGEVWAEVMPAGKAEVVKRLQEEGEAVVAMVGDGINDSPALAAADVGMAIGAGTDIAIEAADYVLMRNNLEDVITAIHLSRTTFSRIRLNYVFAMAYNTVAIPVAAGALYPSLRVVLPPWAAGACMALSSVTVVCSSLLLRMYKRPSLTSILQITAA